MGVLTTILRELILPPEEVERRRRFLTRDPGVMGSGGGINIDSTPNALPGTKTGTAAPQQQQPQQQQPQYGGDPTLQAIAATAGGANGTAAPAPSGRAAARVTPQADYSQTPQASINGSRFTQVGDTSHVNPALLQTLHAASTYLPDGYRVVMSSGFRDAAHNAAVGGAQNSQHVHGNAVDVHIIDPNGNTIPNRNQGPDSPYGILARAGYHYLQSTNPDMAAKFNWGGNFNYHGFADSMHYDFGNRPGGQLPSQYQQYGQQDNFKPWDQSRVVAQQQPAGAQQQTAQAAQAAQGAPGAQGGGWQPGEYPNAPIESKQQMSHPERNNPGNLRVAGTNDWQGKVTQPGDAFERFSSVGDGVRARAMTYASYINRGVNTIDKISNTSGPASDNNDIPSQNRAYATALGGKYAQPGGEHLPIDFSPENVRRLTAGGISIEAGGGGKWLPQGVNMGVIDSTISGMHQAGRFGNTPSSTPAPIQTAQTAQNTPTGSSTPTPSNPPSSSTSASPQQIMAALPPAPSPATPQSTPAAPPPQTAAAAPAPDAAASAQKAIQMAAAGPTTKTESYRRPAITLLRPF